MDENSQQPQDQNPDPGTFGTGPVPGGAPEEGDQGAGVPPVVPPADPGLGGEEEGEETTPPEVPEVGEGEEPSEEEQV